MESSSISEATCEVSYINEKDKFISESLLICFEILRDNNYIQAEQSSIFFAHSEIMGKELADLIINFIDDLEIDKFDEVYLENELDITSPDVSEDIETFSYNMKSHSLGKC